MSIDYVHFQGIFKCLRNNRCEINVKTRHMCSSCRLDKCFQSGMQAELIRHWPQGKSARKRSEKNIPISTINVFGSDTSSLTRDQWELWRTLTSVYDLEKLTHVAQSLRSLSSTLDTRTVKTLWNTFYAEAGETCRKNEDLKTLFSPERSAFLSTVIDNITCLGTIYVCAQTNLVDCPEFLLHLEAIYEKKPVECFRWTTNFVRCDDILFKLGLGVFALSTNSRSFGNHCVDEFIDMKSLLSIENRYVELIWKYLLSKNDFRGTVKCFDALNRCFLATSVFIHSIHSTGIHFDDLQSLVEEVEMEMIMEDVD